MPEIILIILVQIGSPSQDVLRIEERRPWEGSMVECQHEAYSINVTHPRNYAFCFPLGARILWNEGA